MCDKEKRELSGSEIMYERTKEVIDSGRSHQLISVSKRVFDVVWSQLGSSAEHQHLTPYQLEQLRKRAVIEYLDGEELLAARVREKFQAAVHALSEQNKALSLDP